jgi:hypothetical protein
VIKRHYKKRLIRCHVCLAVCVLSVQSLKRHLFTLPAICACQISVRSSVNSAAAAAAAANEQQQHLHGTKRGLWLCEVGQHRTCPELAKTIHTYRVYPVFLA